MNKIKVLGSLVLIMQVKMFHYDLYRLIQVVLGKGPNNGCYIAR